MIQNQRSYVDVGYLSDPYNGWSQIRYFFKCGGTMISWWSVKQTIIATSSNHATFSITWGKWNQQPYMKIIVHVLLNWKKGILKIYLQSLFQGVLWSYWFIRLGSDILKMKANMRGRNRRIFYQRIKNDVLFFLD